MDILTVLIEERKAKKITQVSIAEYIGISKSLMSRFESGKMVIDYSYLEKYAEYLGYEIRLLKK